MFLFKEMFSLTLYHKASYLKDQQWYLAIQYKAQITKEKEINKPNIKNCLHLDFKSSKNRFTIALYELSLNN